MKVKYKLIRISKELEGIKNKRAEFLVKFLNVSTRLNKKEYILQDNLTRKNIIKELDGMQLTGDIKKNLN